MSEELGPMSVEREARVRAIVEAILRKRFTDIRIVGINVTDDVDEDELPLLKIDVIFEGNKTQPDAVEVSGLARRVIPKLQEAKESGFPIFSFITKSDWGKMSHAPA